MLKYHYCLCSNFRRILVFMRPQKKKRIKLMLIYGIRGRGYCF